MTGPAPPTARILNSLKDIDATAWDACARADTGSAENQSGPGAKGNPFIRYSFLRALEDSGSATRKTGWAPMHVVLNNSRGDCVGVVPMYLKNHSQGEYVFDHGWAEAFMRAGGDYYPKLQVSVPFTPATGPRLLAAPGAREETVERQLLAACIEVANKLKVSSLHFTFLPEDQWRRLGETGLLQRTDQQFHWINNGYDSFDEFLSELASRKRKNLRKEREAALQTGIEIEWVTGTGLREQHWDAFFRFYQDTGSRKWGRPYLTRPFFSLVSETMADQTLLIMCKRGGRYIAGALNFIGEGTLFGRHWGCVEDHPFLHFEACYYQAIDFAIAHGLKRVEAGAQGAHKLARGYLPTLTYSAHYITNPRFREAVADYLDDERRYVDHHLEALSGHSPFRRSS